MVDTLQFLQQRNSAPKLMEPGPSDAQLEGILRAALRAPDHARLQPWRFLTITGSRRAALGAVLEKCLLLRTPEADAAACAKARNAPMRAPLLVVVVAQLSAHPKVPAMEQRFSAACAAQVILLGAEACGFAGMWRTGAAAYDPTVMAALGLADNEEIIGFLYLGTRNGKAKPTPQLHTADFVASW